MIPYIVIQMVILNQETDTKGLNIGYVTRRVLADNQESAIGKFVIATQNVVVQKKLSIICYELTDIIIVV